MKAAVRPGLRQGLQWRSCLPALTNMPRHRDGIGYVSRELCCDAQQMRNQNTKSRLNLPYVPEYGLFPGELCDSLLFTFRAAALTTRMSLLASHELQFV
jgi:hypothetical protein